MSDGGWEEFDAVDGQEGVSEAHEQSDEDAKNEDNGLSEASVMVLRGYKEEADMYKSGHSK